MHLSERPLPPPAPFGPVSCLPRSHDGVSVWKGERKRKWMWLSGEILSRILEDWGKKKKIEAFVLTGATWQNSIPKCWRNTAGKQICILSSSRVSKRTSQQACFYRPGTRLHSCLLLVVSAAPAARTWNAEFKCTRRSKRYSIFGWKQCVKRSCYSR